MKYKLFFVLSVGLFLVNNLNSQELTSELKNKFNGVLRNSVDNPRYFTDASGKAIFLAGSHTWANFQENVLKGVIEIMDWKGYLDMMEMNNHNFMRLWVWEHAQWQAWTKDTVLISPLPYKRTGQGLAVDGKPKFNLEQFNDDYFKRLRSRVIEAGMRGVYVSIMLFQGWSQNKLGVPQSDPFRSHPYNKFNNINGVDVKNTNSDIEGEPTLHSMDNPQSLKYQKLYVKKVIETVNDLDNVLYEIINEGGTTAWCYYMIDYIRSIEKELPKRHMIGLGNRISPPMLNKELWESPADFISPCWEPIGYSNPGGRFVQDYGNDPPANNKDKVCILDTDHLWGTGGNYKWVWKSVTRGHNPIFMDPWEPAAGHADQKTADFIYIGGMSKNQRDYPDYDLIRKNMGYANRFLRRIDITNMTPREDLSTTKYCLAKPGFEYLVYFPESGLATVDLTLAQGELEGEWFIPVTGQTIMLPYAIKGGYFANFTVPFVGDAVLYLKKK